MTSLNEYLETQEQTEQESFKVTDDSTANWALRKIKQYQEQQEQNNSLAVAEIDKIESWNKQENQRAQDSIDFFQGLLAGYAMQKRESDPKFKSLKLPNGSLKFRKRQPAYKYEDDKLLDFLFKSGRDNLAKVKYSPDKTAIKKAFVVQNDRLIDPETGEFVEGVTVEPREDKFSVEVSE